MSPPHSKLIKKLEIAHIFIKEWATQTCSGATVFHRVVLNVTEKTDQKKAMNIIFFLWKNKSGTHVHQKTCEVQYFVSATQACVY